MMTNRPLVTATFEWNGRDGWYIHVAELGRQAFVGSPSPREGTLDLAAVEAAVRDLVALSNHWDRDAFDVELAEPEPGRWP